MKLFEATLIVEGNNKSRETRVQDVMVESIVDATNLVTLYVDKSFWVVHAISVEEASSTPLFPVVKAIV